MQLQLGKPPGALLDGSTDWNAIAEAALNDWNDQIGRAKFVTTRDSSTSKAQRNGFNNVFFSPDVFGSAWGSGVLGVTLSFRSASTGVATEADVLFNSTRTWESYRGALRHSGTVTILDLRRVATHEFGHVLGLGHPDEDTPPQFVTAIMNSTISSIDGLQADDITGVKTLYEIGTGPPVIVTQPVSRTVTVGGNYTFAVTATGTEPFTYSWGFRAVGANTTSSSFHLATGPSYTIGSVQTSDAGTYTVTVINALAQATSTSATLTVTPVNTSPDTILANLSTLGTVGADDSKQLIAGIVIGGSTSKNILLRAVGPALADFGVPGTLAAPQIKLVNGAGVTVAQAAAWGASPDAAKFPAAFARLGAFQYKAGSADSAILATLPPGSYNRARERRRWRDRCRARRSLRRRCRCGDFAHAAFRQYRHARLCRPGLRRHDGRPRRLRPRCPHLFDPCGRHHAGERAVQPHWRPHRSLPPTLSGRDAAP